MANRNMKRWVSDLVRGPQKKPLPILAFPSVAPLGTTVGRIIASGELQARGMAWIAAHTDAAASVSFMDLSVEAECFGASVRFGENEVPTVVGRLVCSEEEADALAVPQVGEGRTSVCLGAIGLAVEQIGDRPVLAGMIGPFSLAARLLDVSEIMLDCYDEPEMVRKTVEKSTLFLIEYARAFKERGADGIVIAEPVAGLLSPALEAEFCAPFVKRIVDAVRDDSFAVVYHNCGNNVTRIVDSLLSVGADAYHFGNAVDLCEMLEKMPRHVVVLGNVDPAGQFRLGTPDSVRQATLSLMQRASCYPHFVVSSGCDIPPATPWENVEAFFAAVRDFYADEK